MSVCIIIYENNLERVAEQLDNNVFKYKFLFDSDDKYKTIKEYNLKLVDDCLMFSGMSSFMRANRYKTRGKESEKAWSSVVETIFDEERHVAIVNDYYDNPNLVLVLPTTFYDPTQREGNNVTTLSDEIMDIILYKIATNLNTKEGMNVVTWETYNSDVYKDRDPDNEFFKATQKRIKETMKSEYRQEVLRIFIESFKFRMITYYTKLRDYNLDDIMRKLNELGYLDDRFNGEIYLYEEEARRLLAKRLCAISYKNDIKILIEEGILNPDKIPYNLDV
jgi:hypothetical protein